MRSVTRKAGIGYNGTDPPAGGLLETVWMEEPTPLVLREECRQDSVIVSLEGELDTVSECRLNGLVTQLVAKEARQVLFDLSGVRFLDTSGIRGLISAQRRLFLAGRSFGLVGVPQMVQNILSVTGLQDHFVLYETVEEALA
jgi:anti-anti-sigma factor